MPVTRRRFFLPLIDGIQRLLTGAGVPDSVPDARYYRVDATILLLSLPICTRPNVGSGYTRRTVSRGEGGSTHVLEFAAGSLPERARGLNRLGMIRETVTELGGSIVEARYFGFMTASREESLGEAKNALNESAAESLFVAIEGESLPGEVSSRRARFISDARADRAGWRRLQALAQSAFRDPLRTSGENRSTCGAAPSTFLFALLRAIRSSDVHLRQNYVYGCDQYELTTVRKADRHAGERLAAKHVAIQAGSVCVLIGTIRNLRTGEKTAFRIWIEEGRGPVPLRIEYQPRSFLQLSLEAERGADLNW